jgi:DNA polymerase III epsilon subunit-like protein
MSEACRLSPYSTRSCAWRRNEAGLSGGVMLERDYSGYERVHELERLPDGGYACRLCKLVWKQRPRTFCAGVPVYRYGEWPEGLYTRTQLRRMKLRPRDPEQPDGADFIRKSPYRRWLYCLSEARPWRVPSPRQAEAIEKMRAGLVARYTCQRCGWYDRSHGKNKYARWIKDGWCSRCWDVYEDRMRQAEQCEWARTYIERGPFIVLDSETTGLDFRQDEVIELAMIDGHTGAVLFNSLIQPEDLAGRSSLATHVHGIDREMLQAAPRFPEVWPVIRAVLRRYGRVLVFNATFDYLMLRNTAARYGYRGVPGRRGGQDWECLMQQYARFNGAWSSYYRGYVWVGLDAACWYLGIEDDGAHHRALSDARRARAVLWKLAEHAGKIEQVGPPQLQEVGRSELDGQGAHPF